MRTWCRRLPVRIDSTRPLGSDLDGYYDWRNNTIHIDRDMPLDAKRCILTHELVHWSHDDHDASHEERCRRETALLLIDPLDYEMAENMYEGDSFEIADQLNITEDVVNDWKRYLDGHPRARMTGYSPVCL